MSHKECWKPVPGYKGMYEVSDHGRVRSLDRYDRRGAFVPGLVLKLSLSPGGYAAVNLCREGKSKTRLFHRLVCETFHGTPDSGQVVRHLNGDRQDNRAVNLAWGTRCENSHDRKAHGTDNCGDKHPYAKLTEVKVRNLRLGKYGKDAAKLARRFKVGEVVIREVLRGTRWTHVDPPTATWNIQPRCKLDAATVQEIREGRYGTNRSAIARELGLTHGAICHAVTGRTWTHVQPSKAVWLDAKSKPVAKLPKRTGQYARGAQHGRSTLTEAQVRALRTGKLGTDLAKIAKRLKVSWGTVYQVASGKTWTHVDPPQATWWADVQRKRGTSGERHHKAKLTEAHVRKIRAGRYGQNSRVIAEQLHVSKSAVEHVIYGRAWASLDPPKALWLDAVAG